MATADRPIIFDGAEHRPMTDAEFAQHQTDVAAWQAAAQAAAEQAAARQSALAKLAALGLTDTEINALIGA